MSSRGHDLLESARPCQIPEGRSPQETMESLATIVRYRRGQEIYRSEERAEHWYRIVSGVARKCALLADGRRRIVDFLLPGDFFGLTARDVRAFTVEAIVEGTVVACYPRRRLERLADSDPQLARRVRELALEAASRLEAQILILGRTTALEKVSSFILEMAQRSSNGAAAEAVVLPMSRYDIADYLALSAETVSRSLTSLKRRAAIRLMGSHRVRIVDRSALQEWSNDCRLD
jgi:CRP/FNR family transcriptional regulator, nitrogen fixation regulation protein